MTIPNSDEKPTEADVSTDESSSEHTQRLLALGEIFQSLICGMRTMEDKYAASRRAATATRDEARELLAATLLEIGAAIKQGSRLVYERDAEAGTFTLMGPSSCRLLFDALAAAGLDPDKRQSARRHWLTIIPADERERPLQVWRDASIRMEVRAFAAAFMVAFGHEVPIATEEATASEIQGALHRGNFDNERLTNERTPAPVGSSTIKSWVETFRTGLTAEGRHAADAVQQIFADQLTFLRHVRDQGVSREAVLQLLEDFCLRVSPPLAEPRLAEKS